MFQTREKDTVFLQETVEPYWNDYVFLMRLQSTHASITCLEGVYKVFS